jgi:hypothetical protein
MAKVEIEVRVVGGKSSWKEEYNCEGDPNQFGLKLIEQFNRTLREGEIPREFVGVKLLDENEHNHKWRKVNAITVSHAGRRFDKYECERCGITGKRHGVALLKRDSKYKA